MKMRAPQKVVGLAGALALLIGVGCGPQVMGSDGGPGPDGGGSTDGGPGGNCAAGSGEVNFTECVAPLMEAENCVTCHIQPTIPMDMIAWNEPDALLTNYAEMVARSGVGEDSLMILYLWMGPRQPDPTHPYVFTSLDDPVAMMLLDWVDCPKLNAGDACDPDKVLPYDNAIDYVLANCDPTDGTTLTFTGCIEPILTYYGQVGVGTGCISCHNQAISRPDVLNFYVIENDFTMPNSTISDLNLQAVMGYSNNDINNDRRIDLVVNAAAPENNLFLFKAFHQDFANCLFGINDSFPVTYNFADGLPAGNHPNTAFACDYTNLGNTAYYNSEKLAEIWYYWVVEGAPL